MATLEQLKLAREKALQSPNLGKRGKGMKTLEKEERRAIFDKVISEKWEQTIKVLKPEYVADQFMGKAPEILEVAPELKKLIEKANKILPE